MCKLQSIQFTAYKTSSI